MKFMTANEIRKTWLSFFAKRGHKIEPSASLIPKDDKTLLWINSGVAPLKKYFDGTIIPSNPRITNSQKCIRTNDIDNVGQTARHHTFFEMLGNFSIGDYFKKEAIKFGYDLITDKIEGFGMDINKIYITYYPSDLDAKKFWMDNGVLESHLIPIEDNYWEIGEGPSGPNTEIFFDRGPKYDHRGIEVIKEDLENDRFIEIWNIVFSQYNSQAGLARKDYPLLPNQNIDTGAGLERIACILQDTKTNFETDLFLPIINELERQSKVKYSGQISFKVIADHIKTLVFAISDGAVLSNEGRGYVLRRLLRRSVKHGRNLGLNEPFLFKLVETVVTMMGSFYVDLVNHVEIIKKIILAEEKKFLETIADGEKLVLILAKKYHDILPGTEAFKLYDTFGFPIELTVEYLAEYNIKVDIKEFEKELQKQQERSRGARNTESSMNTQDEKFLNFTALSLFNGYRKTTFKSQVIKVFSDGIVLDVTPFYATSGGQVHDIGTINNIVVNDVYKLPNGQNLHVMDTKNFKEGDQAISVVDSTYRQDIKRNHTATHLVHQALKDILGNHVCQQGSLVNNQILRFDFNHFENISDNDILTIEERVKNKIINPLPVFTKEMDLVQAQKLGAQALFGEKYGSMVRVVEIDKYSLELCGGIHVNNTSEIIDFAILDISSIGSGIYRITALTGADLSNKIVNYFDNLKHEKNELQKKLLELTDQPLLKDKSFINSYQDVLNLKHEVIFLKEQIKLTSRKQTNDLERDILSNVDQYITSKGKKQIIITDLDSVKPLKSIVDVIFDKLKAQTILLVNIYDDSATFICKSSEGSAQTIIKKLTQLTNGSGGGRPDFAQGGTKDISNLHAVLAEFPKYL